MESNSTAESTNGLKDTKPASNGISPDVIKKSPLKATAPAYIPKAILRARGKLSNEDITKKVDQATETVDPKPQTETEQEEKPKTEEAEEKEATETEVEEKTEIEATNDSETGNEEVTEVTEQAEVTEEVTEVKEADVVEEATEVAPTEPAANKKKVYDPNFLLLFQPLCKEKPEGLPDIDEIMPGGNRNKGRSWQNRGRNFQGNRSRGGGRRTSSGNVKKRSGSPKEVIPHDPNAWQRPSRRTDTSEKDKIRSQAREILNKLTEDKFNTLSQKMVTLCLGLKDVEYFKVVIAELFDKALREPQFSKMYAELCQRMQRKCKSYPSGSGGDKQTFRRLLLNKCQEEFENKNAVQKKLLQLSADDKTYQEKKLRNRMLGNIIFIGQLFKLRILTEKIMHSCVIRSLLPATPSATDLEALCKLMTTVGEQLDKQNKTYRNTNKQGEGPMDHYFKRMAQYSEDPEVPLRTRFILQNAIELRASGWGLAVSDLHTLDSASLKKISEEKERQKKQEQRRMGRGRGGMSRSASNVPTRGNPVDEWEVVDRKQGGRGRRDNYRKGGGGRRGGDGWEVAGGRGNRNDANRSRGGRRGNDPLDRSKYKGRSSDDIYQPPGRAKSSGKSNQAAQDTTRDKPQKQSVSNPFALLSSEEERKPARQIYVPPNKKKAYREQARQEEPEIEPEPEPEPKLEDNSDDFAVDAKVLGDINLLIEEYLFTFDEGEAELCLKDIDNPDLHFKFVQRCFEIGASKKEEERDLIAKLLAHMSEESICTEEHIHKGITATLHNLERTLEDIPFAIKFIGKQLGQAIVDSVITLDFFQNAFTEEQIENNIALAMATQATTTIASQMEQDELQALYRDADLDLLQLTPSANRNPEYLKKYLEEQINSENTLAILTEES
eukprot:CAMPEP_0174257474 /NCGR_PEP_ID=MMETSP0439-20130205/6602_1 /TAXON_ID=0 /ORGANISM="Stereomyxa ramosa, Strain Chinc5" /LENGTH=893 /DNA_ID=CAMNT_0015340569 /DNA_START=29 /DNA_END=2710 /DNA_ORIENTATION=+